MMIIRQAVRMPAATIGVLTCPDCDWQFPAKIVVPCRAHGTQLQPTA
jgi:hypothetical protein